MVISSAIEDRLRGIAWFSRCGFNEDIEVPLAYRISPAWKQAIAAFSDPAWEATTAEAQGTLTEHLSSKYPTMYRDRWNSLAKEAGRMVNAVAIPAAKECQEAEGLSQVFLDCVQWDILHAIMELTYAEYAPHTFFRDLLSVYEQGRFPCGWVGQWPDGALLVI